MKDYEQNNEDDVAMMAEPSQSYSTMGSISKPGRMTVNEYFDEVWKRVIEKCNYIFHLEDDIVIVDRIMPSKMIVK